MSNSLQKEGTSFIGLATLFVVISCLLGYIIAFMVSWGMFERWHPLDNTAINAEKIINADYKTIWVQLKTVVIVTQQLDCDENESQNKSCSEWIDTEDVPEHPLYQMYPLERNTSCDFGQPSILLVAPGPVIECVKTDFLGPESMNTRIYALLENGSLWYRSRHADSFGPIPTTLLCATLLSPLIGLLLAAIYRTFLDFRRKTDWIVVALGFCFGRAA